MDGTRKDTPLPPDASLHAFGEKQAAVSWPLAVDARLERLLDQARAAGERTSRKELVAAIIAFAEFRDEALGDLLRRYRRATVGDVLPSLDSNVVQFVQRKPGPRPMRQ